MSIVKQLEAAGERLSPAVRRALVALEARVRVLEEENQVLRRELTEFKVKLQLDSTNSSRPPSSDPPGAGSRAERRRRARGWRRGAQPGHAAQERRLVPPERVDRVVEHRPEACAHCGHRFGGVQGLEVGEPERRQVIELPRVRAHVSEHRLHRLLCPACRKTTKAGPPAGVGPGTTFGSALVAFCAMLTVRLRASRRNLQRVLADLMDVEPPATGTLQHLLEETSEALAGTYREVRAALRRSPVVSPDETGWMLRGERYTLWAAATPALSLYRITRSRSARERRRLLGGGYTGVVTSDRGGAYSDVRLEQRQVCLAHLKRNFEALRLREGVSKRVGDWGVRELERTFHLWHRLGAGELTREEFKKALCPLQARMTNLLYMGYLSGETKLMRFSYRLLGVFDALWTFVQHEGVPPTNNEAERALRAAVIWRKTSFGSQSGRGIRLLERLLTVAETARKQKHDLQGYLTVAIDAHRRAQAAPPLLATP